MSPGVNAVLPAMGEVSFGFQWLKKHPILGSVAVAAATAVSVYKFISSNEAEEDVLSRGISWGDDNGGALAEVFGVEEDIDAVETISPVTSEQAVTLGLAENRHVHKSRRSFASHRHALTDEKSSGDAHDEDNEDFDARIPSVDYETVSPQWGWYVSITPPHDQYLPERAYPHPPLASQTYVTLSSKTTGLRPGVEKT